MKYIYGVASVADLEAYSRITATTAIRARSSKILGRHADKADDSPNGVDAIIMRAKETTQVREIGWE